MFIGGKYFLLEKYLFVHLTMSSLSYGMGNLPCVMWDLLLRCADSLVGTCGLSSCDAGA